jgi:hypothetical protein
MKGKKDLPILREYGKQADMHWKEVMDLAECYGFILNAYGGIATLGTHKNQLENLGEREYLRIQQMNGHCPKENGYEGCLNEDGSLKQCGSCWAAESGGKYAGFEKKRQENE